MNDLIKKKFLMQISDFKTLTNESGLLDSGKTTPDYVDEQIERWGKTFFSNSKGQCTKKEPI